MIRHSLCFVCLAFFAVICTSYAEPVVIGDYVILGWNDLGMHCISPSFSQVAILPPYNNLWVQVIKRGDPPVIVTTGVDLKYGIINNKTVRGKTDFWTYAPQLFGVTLPVGKGLTGNGLKGFMQPAGLPADHFEATGIPLLPYDDFMVWNPYQIARFKLKDSSTGLSLGKLKVVVPVSDEINCAMCHDKGMDGTVNLANGGTMNVNTNILMVHDYYHGSSGVSDIGPDLVQMQPVLCASCHPSRALGTTGQPGVQSLSLAMHSWHNPSTAPDATCYSCHPGEQTHCYRTAIDGMSSNDTSVPYCQNGACHGGMAGMADPTRRDWLDLPTCESCHGAAYSTGSELYRHAKGHGGVYCAGCHNSPHAWFGSSLTADNMPAKKYQRSAESIGRCSICHTGGQTGEDPHQY